MNVQFLNPFLAEGTSKALQFKVFLIIILFFMLRIPFLFNLFYHVDDNHGLATYPLFSFYISEVIRYLSLALRYKFFIGLPTFLI